ncbi:MAG TPA: c-type cytochrome [Kofleriaceae bacterium]
MRRSLVAGTVLVTFAGLAWASHGDEWEPPEPFALQGYSIGGAKPAPAAPAFLAGSRLAAAGDGALVIDADSGALIRTNASGANTGQLAIGRDAGLLAFDPVANVAYVADRRGDRIVVVTVGEQLAIRTSWKTPAEPYAVALAPDRKTLLVTTIADRRIVAFETGTGRQQFSLALGQEPRGVAIAPDGKRALVTYLTAGMLDEITLIASPAVRHVSIHSRFEGEIVRGSFAALFMGDLAVVPFQGARPTSPQEGESSGSYGGSFNPPISHHLAFIAPASGRQVSAEISVQQPRALAWDGTRDRLYVAGMGSDAIVEVQRASQIDLAVGFHKQIKGCGPDGLAIAANQDVLVWCSFTRSIARIGKKVARGPELVASALDKQTHAGLVQFHTSSNHVSNAGQIACANCHFEGRADGLSWQIEGHRLQTPLLAGRLVGTEPFKWDGTAKDLETSVRQTAGRLGGSGLGKAQVSALAAYLRALPEVRRPTPKGTVARGAALFDSAGCTSCHDGDKYTDQARHKLGGTLKQADTPSLVSLAASAPYFHDGSAATLEAVLRERGRVHGMSETSKQLSEHDVTDLVAYLESL